MLNDCRLSEKLVPTFALYPQKLALTSPTSDSRSVGIVRLRTIGHGVCFSYMNKYRNLRTFDYTPGTGQAVTGLYFSPLPRVAAPLTLKVMEILSSAM
jgi:hypothetical protein